LGSTRELADGSGRIAATYRYDAYGNPLTHIGTATTPFGYAGEYTDAETGLQYLRARYYDPATAQFLSRDPLVATTGQPYAYAAADPLNLTDPSGPCANDLPICPWEAVGQATDAAASDAHTSYNFVTATGSSFARTIGNGAVGTYYSLAEAARLIPLTGPFLDGGIRPYLLHVSGDLSDAAVTANHLDIAWDLVSQSVAAPFKAALACPSATTIGTAAGDTLGNLALLFGPNKLAGLAGRTAANLSARFSAYTDAGVADALGPMYRNGGVSGPSMPSWKAYPVQPQYAGEDILPIPRYRLIQGTDGRWKTINASRTVTRTASGKYLFVHQGGPDGEVFVYKPKVEDPTIYHSYVGRGQEVDYSGEIEFSSGRNGRGIMRGWNNRSGHYLPEQERWWQVNGLPGQVLILL